MPTEMLIAITAMAEIVNRIPTLVAETPITWVARSGKKPIRVH